MKNTITILFAATMALFLISFRQGMAATDAPTVAELLPPDAGTGDGFGASIALFHDTLAIGAPGSDLNGTDSGAVYVFTRSGTSWQKQAVLVAGQGSAGDRFGAGVSISGDTIVGGAPGADDKGEDSGAALVFVRSGTTWQEQTRLAANDTAAGDGFGFAVTIDGDTIAVGAPFDDTKGSAYTFLRSAGTWQQQAKLLAYSGGAAGDRFGCSVATGYYTVVVGADGDDTKAIDDGSAFVYTPYGSGWVYQAKLVASDAAQGDRFGWSVAVGLDKALIGVNRTPGDEAARPGAAYAFIRTGSSWAEKQRFKGNNEGTDDGFGAAVALYDNFYLIGAPRETVDTLTTGAAYLFSRAETSPWPRPANY
ncbi:MAG: FG-GAP repeat protein, partial [Desulfobulbaceae bacterium]